MQIDIQALDFPLTHALRNHAERRMRFALTCCDDHIQRVVMRLSDINGPRGGADKRCQVQVVLAGLPDVVIEDTEADLYIAIDRATERAGQTLLRKVDRRNTLLKQDRSQTRIFPEQISH
jgi:ribosome-associated translation inhibitor RaiA